MILSDKSWAPGGGAPWAELKRDEHLRAITSKTHSFDAISLTSDGKSGSFLQTGSFRQFVSMNR